jgi:hypothetical protein
LFKLTMTILCPTIDDLEMLTHTLRNQIIENAHFAAQPAANPVIENTPAPAAPAAPAVAAPARRPRADKGKPRPNYNRAAASATAPASEPAAPVAKPVTENTPAPAAPAAPAAAAPAPKVEQSAVTEAGKAVYDAKGLEVARALLQRMGATTMRDLKPEQWAEYVELAKQTVSGKYDPLASA